MKIEEMQKTLSVEPRQTLTYKMYCRKSTESEDRQVESIQDQINILTELADAKNIHIESIYQESKSAKAPGRKEFNKLLEDIDQGNVNAIVCWKLNRLFRNPEDEGKIRQRLSDGRLQEIVTPSKIYLEADTDFTMAVEGAQAQRFIRDLREDTKRGTNKKLLEGKAPLLAPPGYRNTPEKKQGQKTIEPDPRNFKLMRRLFDLFLTGNYSVAALHKQALQLGITNSRNKPLSSTQIYVMLRNPFYTGTRYYYAKKLYTNGTHKRMITDEEFDLVQDILNNNSRPRGQKRDLLTGLMICGECGRSITADVHTKTYKNGNTQEFVYYRCTKKNTTCSQKYINANKLEEQVADYLQKLELHQDFIDLAIEGVKILRDNKTAVRDLRLKKAQENIENTTKKLDRLYNLMIEGALEQDIALIKKEELKNDLIRFRSEIDNTSSIGYHVDDLAVDTCEFTRDIINKYKTGTIQQKKTILRVIGSNLIIKDQKIHIELREPFKLIKKTILQLGEVRDTKLPKIEAKLRLAGSNSEVVGSLLNEVRTHYGNLTTKELLFYRTMFDSLSL